MKITILGCKGTTLDLLNGLTEAGVAISQVVTLSGALAAKSKVAFYCGDQISAYCEERGIPCQETRSYNLQDPADVEFFEQLQTDLVLVLGWERLLPAGILGSIRLFACGMHGSPFGLPRGRGRSPLNWALITGQRKFLTYLFRYTAGVDDGDIIGSRAFDINEHDTIATLHQKNRIAMLNLVIAHLPHIEDGTAEFWRQPDEEATFYPKRVPEDGIIDWNNSTEALHRFIRALAPPYPGAFCFLGDKQVQISAAQPFDNGMFAGSANPGTITDVSLAAGSFVVKTIDASLLVTEFSGVSIDDLAPGALLRGGDQSKVLAAIRERYADGLSDSQKEI